MNFDQIVLEKEQKDLLITLVEATRKLSGSERRKFFVVQTMAGDSLIHPGLADDEKEIYYGDVEVLAHNGLLNLGFGSRGSPKFDVSPTGFQYYEYIKKQMGQPVERVEKAIRGLIESEAFQKDYPLAYQKWSLSEELLWESETKEGYSTIGHYCREALQEFADVLAKKYDLQTQLDDKAKTVGRVRAVLKLRAEEIGSSYKDYLDSLLDLYQTTNSLVQRQEHGALKEGEDLTWEDARRVVFTSMFVMFEIHQAVA